jgi:hypothetical protein
VATRHNFIICTNSHLGAEPGLTFGLLGAYTLVALAAGAWALTRRDA